jgi:hypothetical protein
MSCGDTIVSPGLGYTINVGSYQSYFQSIYGIDSFEQALTLPSGSPISYQYRNALVNFVQDKKRFCIYYGFPSLVNGSTTIQQAIDNFAFYDTIVFPIVDQVAFPAEYTNLQQIVAGLLALNKKVFGYVQVGSRTVLDISTDITYWQTVNANITGVLLDEFGFDFFNTRDRMVTLLDTLRIFNLGFILNAFNPDDIFSTDPNPLQNITLQNNGKEFYLFESFGILDAQNITCTNNNADFQVFVAKVQKILNYGVQQFTLACTTNITSPVDPFNQDLFNEYYYMCELMGYAGFYWSEYNFSANINPILPFHVFTGNPRDFLNNNNSNQKSSKKGNNNLLIIQILIAITLIVFIFYKSKS